MSGVGNKQERQDKTFATDSRRHIVTYSKVRPHECLVCHKGFVRADSLKNHICIQAEGKPAREIIPIDFTKEDAKLKGFIPKRRDSDCGGPATCEICGKYCTSLYYLKVHLRKHTREKPYVCELCGKAYILKNNLKGHLRSHTGERPYPCEQCNKTFTWKNSLNLHVRVAHTGERPFPCKLCRKRFPTIFQLQSHNIYHTKQLNYACPVCKRKFHWRTSCLNHMKIHPGNSMRPVLNKSLQKEDYL